MSIPRQPDDGGCRACADAPSFQEDGRRLKPHRAFGDADRSLPMSRMGFPQHERCPELASPATVRVGVKNGRAELVRGKPSFMPTQTRSQGNRRSPRCALLQACMSEIGVALGSLAVWSLATALDGELDRSHAVLMDPLWFLA